MIFMYEESEAQKVTQRIRALWRVTKLVRWEIYYQDTGDSPAAKGRDGRGQNLLLSCFLFRFTKAPFCKGWNKLRNKQIGKWQE